MCFPARRASPRRRWARAGACCCPAWRTARCAFRPWGRTAFRHRHAGRAITAATVLAGRAEVDGHTYYRWTAYALENGVQTISTRVTDASGHVVPPETAPQWAGLAGEVAIAGVERLTLAFLRSPADDRREGGVYGVPITYGCEALMREIGEHMRLIGREYRLTRPMLGLSAEMWRDPFDGGETGIARVRRTVQDGEEPFIPIEGAYDEGKTPWLVYAPEIRHEAMYARLDRLFALLEKAVGTSRGILTAPETGAATATEIRAANHDTFALVSAIRRMWEAALADMAYAADVLCEFYGLTPRGARGEYAVGVDWDMSLFESSQESFSQLCELHDRGLLSGAELRQWVRGGTLAEAEEAVGKVDREGAVDNKLSNEINVLPNGLLRVKVIRTWKIGNSDVPSGSQDAGRLMEKIRRITRDETCTNELGESARRRECALRRCGRRACGDWHTRRVLNRTKGVLEVKFRGDHAPMVGQGKPERCRRMPRLPDS